MNESKWVNYDVARSRLHMLIGEYSTLIHTEEQNVSPDMAKIAFLESEQNKVIDQYDILSADDIELTSRIASPDWTGAANTATAFQRM